MRDAAARPAATTDGHAAFNELIAKLDYAMLIITAAAGEDGASRSVFRLDQAKHIDPGHPV